MVPEEMLGTCQECGNALAYNIYNHPYCVRCDGLRVAVVCPYCGHNTAGGVFEEEFAWYCEYCGAPRDPEFSHYDMGSGSAKPGIKKLFWTIYHESRRRYFYVVRGWRKVL